MVDLSCSYMGLQLKTPLIASSSGLTSNINDIKLLEKNGVGAVVLKSLFEEEIIAELEKNFQKMHSENYLYPETMEFYEKDDTEDTLTAYLKLINDSKKKVKIPVIASINCITAHNWPYFARSIQDAGADAIELNIFLLPSNTASSCIENEQLFFDIISKVKKEVTIPVSVKISHYFSNLYNMIENLSKTGIQGIVLFNRFYSPDIDTDNLEVIPSHVYSSPNEFKLPLQWIGLTANKVNCDLSASTGVHEANTAIKMILAGANSVQLASVLYKKGFQEIQTINNEIKSWMSNKGFNSISDFRGILSQAKLDNPAGYMRLQFMKHFAGKQI